MLIQLCIPAADSILSFSVDGQTFVKDLKLITSIFSSDAEFMLALEKGNLAIVGADTTKTCAIVLNALECSGDGCFIFDPKVLNGVLNNRAEIKFTLQNSQLSFSAAKGKYTGNMTTQPAGKTSVGQINILLATKVEAASLPESVFATLDKAIKYCKLGDSYAEIDSELVRYIIGNKNKITIATYDQFHSALLTTKVDTIKNPFKIAVYQSHFDAIHKLAKQKEVQIAINDRYFYVSGPHFFLSLPPIQYNEQEFEVVHGIINDMITKEKIASCNLDTKALSNAIENICSIYEMGSKIELTVKQKRIDLKLATSHGSITDALAISDSEGTATINFDAPPLKDVLKCSPPNVCRFAIVENKAYTLEYKFDGIFLNYMVAVLQ